MFGRQKLVENSVTKKFIRKKCSEVSMILLLFENTDDEAFVGSVLNVFFFEYFFFLLKQMLSIKYFQLINVFVNILSLKSNLANCKLFFLLQL